LNKEAWRFGAEPSLKPPFIPHSLVAASGIDWAREDGERQRAALRWHRKTSVNKCEQGVAL